MFRNEKLRRNNILECLKNSEKNYEFFLKNILNALNDISFNEVTISEKKEFREDRAVNGLLGILFWDSFKGDEFDLRVSGEEGGKLIIEKAYMGNDPIENKCVKSLSAYLNMSHLRLDDGYLVEKLEISAKYDGKKLKSSFSMRGDKEAESLVRESLPKNFFYGLIGLQ